MLGQHKKKTMGLSQRIEEEKLIDTSEQLEEDPITVTATRQKSENKNNIINEKLNQEPHKPTSSSLLLLVQFFC